MDRYLYKKGADCSSAVTENTVQQRLLGKYNMEQLAATFLLLASKFDEIDDNIPLIEEMCKTYKIVKENLDLRYDKVTSKEMLKIKDIKACELEVLYELDWDLNSITPLHFTMNFIFQGLIFTNDMVNQNQEESSMSGLGLCQPAGFMAVGSKAMSKFRKYLDYFSL